MFTIAMRTVEPPSGMEALTEQRGSEFIATREDLHP